MANHGLSFADAQVEYERVSPGKLASRIRDSMASFAYLAAILSTYLNNLNLPDLLSPAHRSCDDFFLVGRQRLRSFAKLM